MPVPGELRVFTAGMKPVGSIHPAKGINVSWALREDGACTFTIPKTSLRWSEQYVRHLHRIEYHDERVPEPWLGVIIDHAPADADVSITCVGARWLYSKRLTDRYVAGLGTETAGQIAHMLHQQAVRLEPLGIEAGKLDLSGPTYYVEYQLKPVAQGLDELADLTGGYWWIEKKVTALVGGVPVELPGRGHADPWRTRWSRQKGTDKSGTVLVCAEVRDLPSFRSTAQGIVTAAHVQGVAVGTERLYQYVPDKAARIVYGLLEGTLDFPDIIDPTLLEEAGKRQLVRVSRPVKTLALNVDNRRNMWGKFWLGDYIRVVLTNVDYLGLDLLVRVVGIQLDVDSGAMGLVVELAG